jgi:hypothetical protein
MELSRRTVLATGLGAAAVVPLDRRLRGAGPVSDRTTLLATSWFVDSAAGLDTNAGTSSGVPFKTLGKALTVLVSGDTLNLKRGSVFTERLDLTGKAAGTTVQAYSSGNDPVIDLLADAKGSAGDWTQDGSASRWFRTLPAPTGGWGGFLLVINGKAGNYIKTSAAAVTVAGDYHFNTSTSTLYVFSATNPASAFSTLQYPPQAHGGRSDIGLFMGAPDDPRNATAAAGCSVSNLVIRGARRNIQLRASATLTDVVSQFSASTGITLSYGGTYTLTRVKSYDAGSGLVSGEHTILFAGSGSTNVRGVVADWTSLSGNRWRRPIGSLGSPAGAHLVRDWMDFPSRRFVPPQASDAAVTGPEDWFLSPTGDLTVYATSNPASAYTVLLGGRYELINANLSDCEFDYAGEDAFQLGGNVHPNSQITVGSTAPGLSRISRGLENAVDIKSGNVTFGNTWIWQDTPGPSNRIGPTVTLQGHTRDVDFTSCTVSNMLTGKPTMDVQEFVPKISSQSTMWYSKNTNGTGVVLSHYNGQPHSYTFDLFYNDSRGGQGLPVVAISGDHLFTHCGFHSNSTSSTVRAMHYRGNSTFAANCTAITCDTSTVITEGGIDHHLATVQWDGTEIYLGPGASFRFSGLGGSSAAFNGIWRVRDGWYAINGTANTRSFSTFLVPTASNPPATGSVSGLAMRYFARLNQLRGCTFSGKTEIIRMDADVTGPTTAFPIAWNDMVPDPLDENHWAQRANSTQRLVTLASAGVTTSYTAAQVTTAGGALSTATGGKWGGTGNVADTDTADVQEAFAEPAVTAITVSGEVATVTAPGHGLVRGKKVIITGVTAPATGLEGAFFVQQVIDANTFTYRTVRGVPNGAATLSAAKMLSGKPLNTSAGWRSAPSYPLPAGQKDLQGITVPATGRSFGPVVD